MFKKLRAYLLERKLKKYGYKYRIGDKLRYGSAVVKITGYYNFDTEDPIYIIDYFDYPYSYERWLHPLYEFKLNDPKELSRYLHMKLVDDGIIQT